VARGPRSYEQIRAVDPGFGQALCHMMDLTVETVGEAAEELLAATGGARAPETAAPLIPEPQMPEAPDA
jgi:hypothetical protein